MKHEEIKGKIAAFMDGEVKEEVKDEIVHHLATCKSCSDEYEALLGLDSYLKNTGDINPPAFFRETLERRIKAGRERKFEFSILKLIPATAVLAAFVLFASAFIVVSPILYAGDGQDTQKQAVESIKSAVVTCMTASVFAPAAYAAFCDKCGSNMCKCCMAKDPNHKCQCGGHNHGK